MASAAISEPQRVLAATHVVNQAENPKALIKEAIRLAHPGDTVVVRSGRYYETIVIDKPIELVGEGAPTIDGGGEGTVIMITSPGVTVRGFHIVSSGASLNREDTGLMLDKAGDSIIEGNLIEDVLFGIYLKDSGGTLIRKNKIIGKDLPVASRGDGIRLWYSSQVQILENTVEHTRDLVIWFSTGTLVKGNRVEGGRYGLHYMYSNDNRFEDNVFKGNFVGGFLMYSKGISFKNNIFAENRGFASGYGVGFKDVDDVVMENNLFLANRVGIYIDNSPPSYGSINRAIGNEIRSNDIGISAMPSVERNVFSENSFVDNSEQVEVRGGGSLVQNEWSEGSMGNFWSDYVGYDGDGDGVGDIPYVSESLLENLIDSNPTLWLFILSPAAEALEFAAKAFPALRPEPKLIDRFPLIKPLAVISYGEGKGGVSLGLLIASSLVFVLSVLSGFHLMRKGW